MMSGSDFFGDSLMLPHSIKFLFEKKLNLTLFSGNVILVQF